MGSVDNDDSSFSIDRFNCCLGKKISVSLGDSAESELLTD